LAGEASSIDWIVASASLSGSTKASLSARVLAKALANSGALSGAWAPRISGWERVWIWAMLVPPSHICARGIRTGRRLHGERNPNAKGKARIFFANLNLC
jgi:hypothetical protein